MDDEFEAMFAAEAAAYEAVPLILRELFDAAPNDWGNPQLAAQWWSELSARQQQGLVENFGDLLTVHAGYPLAVAAKAHAAELEKCRSLPYYDQFGAPADRLAERGAVALAGALGQSAIVVAGRLPTVEDRQVTMLIEFFDVPDEDLDNIDLYSHGKAMFLGTVSKALARLDEVHGPGVHMVCLATEGQGMKRHGKFTGTNLLTFMRAPELAGVEFHLHPPAGMSGWAADLATETGAAAVIHPHEDEALARITWIGYRLPLRMIELLDPAGSVDSEKAKQCWLDLTDSEYRDILDAIDNTPAFSHGVAELVGIDWRDRGRATRKMLDDRTRSDVTDATALIPEGAMLLGYPYGGIAAMAGGELNPQNDTITITVVQGTAPAERGESSGHGAIALAARSLNHSRDNQFVIAVAHVNEFMMDRRISEILRDPQLSEHNLEICFADNVAEAVRASTTRHVLANAERTARTNIDGQPAARRAGHLATPEPPVAGAKPKRDRPTL